MKTYVEEDDDNSGEGKSTAINYSYSDPALARPRDDQLSEHELNLKSEDKKRRHKGHVVHEQKIRKDRAAIKEGKQVVNYTYTSPYAAGGQPGLNDAHYKNHPALIRFNGMNPAQINPFPSQNTAVTNPEEQKQHEARLDYQLNLKNELTNQYQRTYRPEFKPR